jgi:hypothetical protein
MAWVWIAIVLVLALGWGVVIVLATRAGRDLRRRGYRANYAPDAHWFDVITRPRRPDVDRKRGPPV